MFDVSDDAKGEFRRVEILTGPGRRQRWSADEKARIVAETLVPGARVSEVARRWQICSQQIFGWRRAMRQDVPSVPGERTTPATPSFVPIVSEAIPAATVQRAASVSPEIEVKLAGAVVRVSPGMDDTAQLTAVLRAVRASASRS
jgi:transposase